MMIWLAIFISGLAVFLTRFSFIGILNRRDISPAMKSLLGYVSTAVLTAIVATETFITNHEIDMTNPKIPALVIAGIAAVLSRSVVITIAVGLVSLYILKAIFP